MTMNTNNSHSNQQEESQEPHKDQPRQHSYTFSCLDCKKTFDITSKEADVNKIFPNLCPFCGAKRDKGRLEWKFKPVVIVDDMETRRKSNREASQDAASMAARFSRENPPEEMITVTGPPSRFSSGSESVPKKAVDILKDQLMPK